MFTKDVNSAFKHFVENVAMHESVRRLFEGILIATNGKVDGFKRPGDVADYLGLKNQATITNWKSRGMSQKGLVDAQEKTGINPAWLTKGEGEMFSSQDSIREPATVTPGPNIKGQGRYPVIDAVQAGSWKEVCNDGVQVEAEEWGYSQHNLGHCGYMLRVQGKSMTNTESGAQYSFPEGMLLHVNPDIEAIPGKFVIVRRSSENGATFKRLVSVDGELYLEAINPSWPNRYIKLEQGDHICGVVVDASFGNLP